MNQKSCNNSHDIDWTWLIFMSFQFFSIQQVSLAHWFYCVRGNISGEEPRFVLLHCETKAFWTLKSNYAKSHFIAQQLEDFPFVWFDSNEKINKQFLWKSWKMAIEWTVNLNVTHTSVGNRMQIFMRKTKTNTFFLPDCNCWRRIWFTMPSEIMNK